MKQVQIMQYSTSHSLDFVIIYFDSLEIYQKFCPFLTLYNEEQNSLRNLR